MYAPVSSAYSLAAKAASPRLRYDTNLFSSFARSKPETPVSRPDTPSSEYAAL